MADCRSANPCSNRGPGSIYSMRIFVRSHYHGPIRLSTQMRGRELIEHVAKKRLEQITKEVEQCFPGAQGSYCLLADERAHITITWEKVIIGEQY